MGNRIMFCNVAYMEFYDYELKEETPKFGGKYVSDTGDALEKYNFHLCVDNKYKGFVETKYRGGYSDNDKKPNQIHIENIDSSFKKNEEIDAVTVVFCAHSEKLKKTVIVGWYQNATVYRHRKEYNGRQYNLECDITSAFLLPTSERSFIVPRAQQSDFGFGQSNIWYAKEDIADEYVHSVFKYINNYHYDTFSTSEDIPQAISDIYEESGIGKKITVNKYERNPHARRKCLEIFGTNCLICGFSSAEVYGNAFKDKIEVHHIVPINEINSDYKIDPSKDLIPVCPNCHTMLHTKMPNGEYPTIKLLRSIFIKK